jgi:P-type E1-E2 ATPase
MPLPDVDWIREEPGTGLRGKVGDAIVLVTNRAHASGFDVPAGASTGLECIVILNDAYAATFRFHDVPRADSRGFVGHLAPAHGFSRVLLVSGDREPEVRRLAEAVAIAKIHAGTSPEEKVAIVQRETAQAGTVFIGDGINDAPALLSATVGIAFGQRSDVTSEAARIIIIDSSLSRVDDVIHLSYRMRRIALQSAIGGMVLSGAGMLFAAGGLLPPVMGAVAQELIDLVAVLNALRTARWRSVPGDYSAQTKHV